MQIYCDFSGYTDIAIGSALAARLRASRRTSTRPTGRAASQDFWRRWHISLSTWLRDYLYIPLGGNRGGRRGDLPQPDAHDAARRALARGRLDLRLLGRAPRRRARARAVAAAAGGGPGPPARAWGPAGQIAARSDLPLRLSGLDFLPRAVARGRGARARAARPGDLHGGEPDQRVLAVLAAGFLTHFAPRAWTDGLSARFGRLPAPLQGLATAAIALALKQVATSTSYPSSTSSSEPCPFSVRAAPARP